MSLQVGEVGHAIIIAVTENGVTLDVSAATGITIFFDPPSAAAVKSFTGVVHNGPLGQFRYTTQASTDLDEAGTWQVQVEFTLGSWTGPTTVVPLRVRPNL